MNNEERILHILEIMQSDIGGMKSEIGGMKSEIEGIKSEMGGIKSQLDEIKAAQNETNKRLDILETKVDSVGNQIDEFEAKTANYHLETLQKIGSLEKNVTIVEAMSSKNMNDIACLKLAK